VTRRRAGYKVLQERLHCAQGSLASASAVLASAVLAPAVLLHSSGGVATLP